MNVKHIAATLAILGSASFSLAGCNKSKEGTEVPVAEPAAEKKEGSCGENKDGSCSAKPEGDAAAGDAAAGDAAAEPPAAE
jgi:hypothetical protein